MLWTVKEAERPIEWEHFPQPVVNTPHTHANATLSHVSESGEEMHRRFITEDSLSSLSILDLKQTDKLFLWVSALCVAHNNVFKETTLKRSVCPVLSRPIWQDGWACCHELFGDDAQAPRRCLLSQHIHQLQPDSATLLLPKTGDMASFLHFNVCLMYTFWDIHTYIGSRLFLF